MQKIIALSIFAALLTGCAAKVITANERMVMVHAGPLDAANVLTMAQAECAKFDRHARLTAKPNDDMQWAFDCIK